MLSDISAQLTAMETKDSQLRKEVESIWSGLKVVASSLQVLMRWVGDMEEHMKKVRYVLQLMDE